MICRSCRKKNLYLFLYLGNHPHANDFLTKDALQHSQQATFPLNVYVCFSCALIQVKNYIPPGFFKRYVYVPSTAESMVKHFSQLAKKLIQRFNLSHNSLVIDIGSNDGTLLSNFKGSAKVLGIEPASNLARVSRRKRIETFNAYFNEETASKVRKKYGSASVITTTNTMNSIDNLHQFMIGVKSLLSETGVFIIEIPHSIHLIKNNEFDTIYHEHLSEFSVKSIVDLFDAFDMVVFDIESFSLHGGSMRIYGGKKHKYISSTRKVFNWIDHEKSSGLYSKSTYDRFSKRVEKNKKRTLKLLRTLKKQGKTILGYGAPAKGNTLLNYYKIGTETLNYLVDKNPLKQGLYTPGMHIPIFPVERIMQDQPDYLFILSWNFKKEIIQQQQEYKKRGGRFIVPIPEPKILYS